MAKRGEPRELELPYTARVRMAPLLVICVFGVCLTLLLLALRPLGVGRTPVILLALALWAGVVSLLLWLGSYRIEMLPDRLRYAWLGGRQEIAYDELREVTLDLMAPIAGQPDRPSSLLRLRGPTDTQVVLLATRPFREGDLVILLDAIEQLAPHARLDETVRALRTPGRT